MTSKFQDFLRKVLKDNGWSYGQLGELIGVTQGAIGTWVRGTSDPDPKSIRALAEFLNVEPEELFIMLDYLPPNNKPSKIRPAVARILRLLDPLEDPIVELVEAQLKSALIPFIIRMKQKLDEETKRAKL
jgi:transcriptional regulator with XRE-family HTH domain